MIAFHKPCLEDRVWAQPLLNRFGGMGSESAFGTYFIWQEAYGFEIAQHKGFFLAWCPAGYFFPIGEGSLQEVLDDLAEDAAQRGEPLRLIFAEPCDQKLKEICPGK